MAELKTKQNDAPVAAFIDGVEDVQKRADCWAIAAIMQELTGEEPKMWGNSIVGFSSFHYKSVSQEGDWPRISFSPRKLALTIYLQGGYANAAALLSKLGKHKIGGSCLYIKKLTDIDQAVLRDLILQSMADLAKRYG